MHKERERWAQRLGNDWPVSARAAAVLDADVAGGPEVANRALKLAVELWMRVPWKTIVNRRLTWNRIADWVGVSFETLMEWCERPEWAQACARAVEPLLTRIARDAAFARLDPVALARDAALLAAGRPAELRHRLPSAFLAVDLPAVRGELGGDLAMAALDLSATEGLPVMAQLIRREQRRAEEEPGYTAAGALAARCESMTTQIRWRAVERRDTGETLTPAQRDALYRARGGLEALGLHRARSAS